jgi:Sulfatase
VAPPVLSLQSVEDLLASIEEGEDPTLHYLHLLLPHTPYTFLPDGRRYSEDVGGLTAPLPRIASGRSEEPAAVDFEEQRLLLQASYTDSVVGRVMQRLRDAGLYDDAIVVVTADHGVGLVPGGAVRSPVGGEEIFPENYPDLFYVPLVVKAPGLEEPATVSDANVGTVDILPTIAAALGVDLPWEVDGMDLGAGTPRGPDKRTRVILIGGDAVGGGLSLGELVRYDGEAVLAEVLARHIDTLLRDDNPRYRLYDVDDAGEIVGADTDELTVVGDSGVSATLDDPGAFLDVNPSSGLVPTHLSADLEDAGDGALTVAIAVNGVVAAVSPTWVDGDQSHHLEAMLVPDTFEDGANEVRLYVVGGTEGDRTLAPIALAG